MGVARVGLGRTAAALAFAALLSGALTGVPRSAAGSDPVRSERSASARVLASPVTPRATARAVRQYWTPARMRAAVPLDLDASGDPIVGEPAVTAPQPAAARPRVTVPRTTGKLFFRADGRDAVCSAAVIDTERRDQVVTAGHCVHTGPNAGLPLLSQPHFYSHWVFVPRYHRGRAPLGRWVARKAWVPAAWAEEQRFAHDQAIVAFLRRGGRRLVGVTGANRVVLGRPASQPGVRIWGWPAERPYDGETAEFCQGHTARASDTGDSWMGRCPMTGGASGGPWLMRRGRTAHTGWIYAVTSRRLVNRPVLLARPIPWDFRRVIRAANP